MTVPHWTHNEVNHQTITAQHPTSSNHYNTTPSQTRAEAGRAANVPRRRVSSVHPTTELRTARCRDSAIPVWRSPRCSGGAAAAADGQWWPEWAVRLSSGLIEDGNGLLTADTVVGWLPRVARRIEARPVHLLMANS